MSRLRQVALCHAPSLGAPSALQLGTPTAKLSNPIRSPIIHRPPTQAAAPRARVVCPSRSVFSQLKLHHLTEPPLGVKPRGPPRTGVSRLVLPARLVPGVRKRLTRVAPAFAATRSPAPLKRPPQRARPPRSARPPPSRLPPPWVAPTLQRTRKPPRLPPPSVLSRAER